MKRLINRSIGLVIAFLIAAGCLFLPQTSVQAATKTKNIAAKTLANGIQFRFKGIPYNGKHSPIKKLDGKKLKFKTVQNFAFTPDGKYVFTTSECQNGSSRHTLITRCQMPDGKGEKAGAQYEEAIILKKYGHGESIAITQPDLTKEIYHLWVACSPLSDGFGTRIARLTYKVTDGKGKITKQVIIKNFKKANISAGKATTFTGKKSPDRVNVAVDPESNQIMFRLLFNYIGVSYVSYDLDKLEKKLDKVGNKKTFDIAKAVSLQKANIRCSRVPTDVFQSFDIVGNHLYICGGHVNKGAQIYEYKYKVYANGKAKETNFESKSKMTRKIVLKLKLPVVGKTLTSSSLEIEGMKLVKEGSATYCYVNFFQDKIPISDNIGVYRFKI